MKLTVKPQIVDNRYSVIIKFKEFGSSALTPEMEQKLIDDYAPKFKLSDLTFIGLYSIDATTNRVVADEINGQEVTLSLPNKEILVGTDLELGYTIHTKEISEKEIGAMLIDADYVAQAKIQLFVDIVKSKIDEMLLDLSKKLNDFEEEIEVEVG